MWEGVLGPGKALLKGKGEEQGLYPRVDQEPLGGGCGARGAPKP